MPTSISILSWNIQILGDTKAERLLAPDMLAMLIGALGPDVVVIQEVVFNHAEYVINRLLAGLKTLNQADWSGSYVQALPGGSDRDGYLFLWRSKYKQQVLDGKSAQGVFNGDFPSNISPRGGRRVGYVGLTLADGSHPFIVAGYHAPTYASASLGSAPATGLVAIATQAAQLLNYVEGGVTKAYEARFLCADFNLDINQGNNLHDWYQPAMAATQTHNVTAANTFLITVNNVPSPRPKNSSDYIITNYDNILAGAPANITHAQVINTIDALADKNISRVAEAFCFSAGTNISWAPNDTFTRFYLNRQYISDHLPVQATFTLVP